MRFKRPDSAPRSSPARSWAVLLCFFLVGIAIVAQAFHLHPNELANSAKHCTICQVSHAPIQVVNVGQLQQGKSASGI